MYYRKEGCPVDTKEVLQWLTASENPFGTLGLTLGTKNIVETCTGFKFDFKMCRKWNTCEIVYDEGLDLFGMRFYHYGFSKKTFRYETKNLLAMEGLYCDQLAEVFRDRTGLSTVAPRFTTA